MSTSSLLPPSHPTPPSRSHQPTLSSGPLAATPLPPLPGRRGFGGGGGPQSPDMLADFDDEGVRQELRDYFAKQIAGPLF